MIKNNIFIAFCTRYRLPLTLWLVCSFYLAYQFITRLSVPILREEIMIKYALNTEQFGLLMGCYYLGYAGMQVPVGILLDRFNIRLVTIACVLLNMFGSLAFILSNSFEYLLFARFLVGTGSACAFLAAAKIIKTYFPAKYHNYLFGLTFTIGLLGGVVGGGPMSTVFNKLGYDLTFWIIIISALLVALLLFIVNDKKLERIDKAGHTNLTFKNIGKILLNPIIIFMGLCGGLMVGSFEGFADTWAMPYLEQIYGYSKLESNFVGLSCVYFGMGIGGPVLAWFASRTKSLYWLIFVCGLLTCTIFAILFYFNRIDTIPLIIIMVILGILCAYQVLIFSLGNSLVDQSFAGITTGTLNCLNMGFGYFIHKIVGRSIYISWDGALNSNGAPIYSKAALVYGLMPIPMMCAAGALGFLFLSYYMKGKDKKIKLELKRDDGEYII